MKLTSQRAENLVHVQQHFGKHFYKKCFSNIAYIADMAIWISNFDNFDIHQVSSKLAQR